MFKRNPLLPITILYIIAILLFYPRAPQPGDIANLAADGRKEVELTGVITTEPRWRRTKRGVIESRFSLKTEKGSVEVRLYGGIPDFGVQDRINVNGTLRRLEIQAEKNGFDYARYLARKGIFSQLSSSIDKAQLLERSERNFFFEFLERLKLRLRGTINYSLPPVEASFSRAILLGERSDLPQGLRLIFAETGTIHILAISGLHIGLIAGFLYLLMRFLGIKRIARSILIIIILISYAILTGRRPPVVRAVIMSTVFLIGLMINRRAQPLNSLSLAALLILTSRPSEVFQVGWQLSFVTVFSIIVLMPRLSFSRRKIAHYFSLSVSAWLGSAPLVAGYFGIVSPVAILANLAVIPLLFIIIVLSFIFLLTNFSPPLVWSERLLFVIVDALHRVRFGHFEVANIPTYSVVLCYAAIFLVAWRLPRRYTLGSGCGNRRT